MRFIMGPICDKYGARIPMGVLLILCAIPTACTGAVNSAAGLYGLRFFIGLAGSAFVMCQAWTSQMFVKEVVGTANGIAAGWGNLGGGVTQLVMGSVLFPLFKLGMSAEMAWRTVCIVPAVASMIIGALTIKFTDDCPKGNFADLKKSGEMPQKSAAASFRIGALNFNSWLMAIQYACCFGVELTLDNAAALYFSEKFGLSTESAAAIASVFGFLNIFSRGLGGYFSDVAMAKFGMRGRLWIQAMVLLLNGLSIFAFAHSNNLGVAIFVLVIFSLFCQAGCGTTFGIVPYVNPKSTGSISGIVGAGGNVGAVCFGLVFRQRGDFLGFTVMGSIVILSAFLTVFIRVEGHEGLLCGKKPAAIEKESPTTDKLQASVAVTEIATEEA